VKFVAKKKVWQQIFFHTSCSCFGIRDTGYGIQDPGSGMGKNQDPGSETNIPDPQHWGQAFMRSGRMIWLHASPLSDLSLFLSLPVRRWSILLRGGGGRGLRGADSYDWEKACPSINHSVLSAPNQQTNQSFKSTTEDSKMARSASRLFADQEPGCGSCRAFYTKKCFMV
jgi:hypothetical protein